MASSRFYLILLTLRCFCVLRTAEGIINGHTATVDQFKYIVQLRVYNSYGCAGSLISPTHVLTAGHCVADSKGVVRPTSPYTVHGGTTFLSDAGVVRKVKNFAIPVNYRLGNKQTYDIAVIKLTSPMIGTNIATIPLCSRAVPSGAAVAVSGWGITKAGGAFSNQLNTVTVIHISKENCQKSYKKGAITPTMICAFKKGKGNCMGDSGGPLVYNGEVCGVVSMGKECAAAQNPGVYTSVSFMRSFIAKHMSN